MRAATWSVAVLVLWAVGVQAADDKGGKGSVDAAKVLAPGDVTGTVVSHSGNTLVLRVEYQTLQRAQRNARPGRNGRGGRQNPLRVVTTHTDVAIELDDTVAYRTPTLPQTFDDKGEIKKPTAEEIKKLKGDNPRLPGYEATASQAGAGAVVTVRLTRNKTTDNELRATLVMISRPSNKPEKAKKGKP